MLNVVTLPAVAFTTYANRPEGSTATDLGKSPAPAVPAGVNAPVLWSTLNVVTLSSPPFAT
jgi:hypothetical protein